MHEHRPVLAASPTPASTNCVTSAAPPATRCRWRCAWPDGGTGIQYNRYREAAPVASRCSRLLESIADPALTVVAPILTASQSMWMAGRQRKSALGAARHRPGRRRSHQGQCRPHRVTFGGAELRGGCGYCRRCPLEGRRPRSGDRAGPQHRRGVVLSVVAGGISTASPSTPGRCSRGGRPGHRRSDGDGRAFRR